ncbi:four-helix bundle copper-binding protein [Streptomyces sp. NPDC003952]
MDTTVFAMLDTHPVRAEASEKEKLARCIEACLLCGQACTVCADACLAEVGDDLTPCITAAMDCADLCAVTSTVLSRRTSSDGVLRRGLLQACTTACSQCADRCVAQAKDHLHCLVCAERCRDAQHACRELSSVLV